MDYQSMFQIGAYTITDLHILIIIFLAAIICYFGKIFSSNVPNLNSKLNRSQTFYALSLSLFFIGIMDFINVFYHYHFLFILSLFLLVVEVLSVLFWAYDPFFYIIAAIKSRMNPTNKVNDSNNYNKFGVIVCAHNEEEVIGNLLESIDHMDYDKKYYDTYVICDNCTDNTEGVVSKFDAIGMVRKNKTKIGKGFAIGWFFDSLKDEGKYNQYDSFVILDADNLVNKEFLSKINMDLNNGEEVIQAYLGCKNPDDSWVSKSYSICYWITNDLFQRAHVPLGFTAQLGGTGMAFKREILDDIGLDGRSLTEDLLFSTEYILKTNKPCYWEEDAIILDEKPLKLSNSLRQRTRWMQGHMNTCENHFIPLLKSSIKNFSFRQFDAAFYLIKPFLNLVLLFGYIVLILTSILVPTKELPFSFITSWQFLIALVLAYLILYSIILARVKRYSYIIWTPLIVLYSLTYYIPIFRGIVKRNENYWVKTEHTRAMGIDENNLKTHKN